MEYDYHDWEPYYSIDGGSSDPLGTEYYPVLKAGILSYTAKFASETVLASGTLNYIAVSQ